MRARKREFVSSQAYSCWYSPCVFLWWGIDFTRFAFNRISELAELPLWYIHLPWPLAGATWIIFLGEQMWDDLRVVAGKAPPPAPKRPADEIQGSIT